MPNPLNTDNLVLGDHTVYFKAYPDLHWEVEHIEGDYVYLGLYDVSEKISSTYIYSGSGLATRCSTYLSIDIPGVADYLEDVTVEGVTGKVFIPTYYMLTGSTVSYSNNDGPAFDWCKTSAANRAAGVNTATAGSNWSNIGGYCWTSTGNSTSSSAQIVLPAGNVMAFPVAGAATFGFRPCVKVKYKFENIQNIPSTYQQVLANMIAINGDGTSANPGLINKVTELENIVDPGGGGGGSSTGLVERVSTLEDEYTTLNTSYPADKIVIGDTTKSPNYGQLPLSVIPKAALERLYNVTTIEVMGTSDYKTYADADNGDTIRDQTTHMLYYVVDNTKFGNAATYLEGLAEYTSGTQHAATADQAENATTVNGHTVEKDVPSDAKFTDTDTIVFPYCTTSAGTAAKTANCTNVTFTLMSGAWIPVLFKYSNSSQSKLTLNINSTGAKTIYINDVISSSSNYTIPAGTYLVYYGTRTVNGTTSTGYWLRNDGTLPNLPDVIVPEVNVMTGATSLADGAQGLAPKPYIADRSKFLAGDATYHDLDTDTRALNYIPVIVTNNSTPPAAGTQKVGDFWLETLT